MSGPAFNEAPEGAGAANTEDSLARAAAAGPPITTDDEADEFDQEPSEAHDSAAAVDEDRTEAGVHSDFAGTEHPELGTIYGPPGGARESGA